MNFIRLEAYGTSSIDIEWIKLEAGSNATYLSPRIFAEEIDLCKRYYNRLTSHRLQMSAIDSNTLVGSITFEKMMRDIPSVSIVEFTYLDYNKGTYVAAGNVGVDVNYTTNQAATISAVKNSSSTISAGNSVVGTIHVVFDAEIY